MLFWEIAVNFSRACPCIVGQYEQVGDFSSTSASLVRRQFSDICQAISDFDAKLKLNKFLKDLSTILFKKKFIIWVKKWQQR